MKCIKCHRGFIRQEIGGAIECPECSAEYKREYRDVRVVVGRRKDVNPYLPEYGEPIYEHRKQEVLALQKVEPAPKQMWAEEVARRKDLFLDKLVAGMSNEEVIAALIAEGKIQEGELYASNVRAWRENHHEEIKAKRRAK